MSYGGYDRDAHRALTESRAALPTEEVFTQRSLHPSMDPRGVVARESRDSTNHPTSNAIIFALDETSSMGDIPAMLAKEELPHFMDLINDGKFIDHPQILFMGIGDGRNGEQAPLQLGQFEAEANLMDQWLTRIYLERKGGGNGGESYDLAFYAAAYLTSIDCFEKRGEKGFLFLTGDEPHFGRTEGSLLQRYLGKDGASDITMKRLVKDASKMYHPFFLIPDLERRAYGGGCERSWRDVLGDNVICMEDPHDTCAVSATLIGLTNGRLASLEAAAKKLTELGRADRQIERIIRAVEPYASSIGIGSSTEQKPTKKK